MLLARHFGGRMALELGREAMPEFSPSAVKALERHAWPGNIRELKNAVERAVYRARGDRIASIQLDPFGPGRPTTVSGETSPSAVPDNARATSAASPLATLPLKDAVARLQRDRLREALEATRFNQRQAASRLGLTYHQLRGLMRKFRETL